VLLTSIDPFVGEFDRLAQRVFGTTNGAGATRSVMRMDGIRRKDDVLLRFDLPGVDAGSIDVTVDRGVLTVSAHRSEERAEGENPFIRERVAGSFVRRIRLSDQVDADSIDAEYTDGVLSVRLPLLTQAQPRKVEIRTDGKPEIAA
jgi:HSP20 family protein